MGLGIGIAGLRRPADASGAVASGATRPWATWHGRSAGSIVDAGGPSTNPCVGFAALARRLRPIGGRRPARARAARRGLNATRWLLHAAAPGELHGWERMSHRRRCPRIDSIGLGASAQAAPHPRAPTGGRQWRHWICAVTRCLRHAAATGEMARTGARTK